MNDHWYHLKHYVKLHWQCFRCINMKFPLNTYMCTVQATKLLINFFSLPIFYSSKMPSMILTWSSRLVSGWRLYMGIPFLKAPSKMLWKMAYIFAMWSTRLSLVPSQKSTKVKWHSKWYVFNAQCTLLKYDRAFYLWLLKVIKVRINCFII